MGLDYDWIADGVAQGSYPEPPRSVFDNGFDVLVLCASDLQARSLKAPSNKRVMRVPMKDDIYRPVSPEVARAAHTAAQDLAREVMRGRRVLITCAQGLNRSALVTGLTLMYLMPTISGRQVVQIIRQRRKHPPPDYPLMNPMFSQFLENTRR